MTVGETVWKQWAEIGFLFLLLVGFIFAISINSAAIIYVVIFLAGVFAGRYYLSKIGRQPLFPFFLIIIGFLFGYMLGAFAANRKVVALLFVIGWIASHIAHKKGWIPR